MAKEELIYSMKMTIKGATVFLNQLNSTEDSLAEEGEWSETFSLGNIDIPFYSSQHIVSRYNWTNSQSTKIFQPSLGLKDGVYQILSLGKWVPSFVIEENGLNYYYLLDYVTWFDLTTNTENDKDTAHMALRAHYRLVTPFFYKNDNGETVLINEVEVNSQNGNGSMLLAHYVDNKSDEDRLDSNYQTRLSNDIIYYAQDGGYLKTPYACVPIETYNTTDKDILAWLKTYRPTVKVSGYNINVEVQIPAVYQKVWKWNSGKAEYINARYKLFLIRGTPCTKWRYDYIDKNTRKLTQRFFKLNGINWSHPAMNKTLKENGYITTYAFDGVEKANLTYTFNVKPFIDQEGNNKAPLTLSHAVETGEWRYTKTAEHNRWFFSVVLVLETNIKIDLKKDDYYQEVEYINNEFKQTTSEYKNRWADKCSLPSTICTFASIV